ncbi:MAG: hypothetical protein JSV78_06215 [Phycisphaerales bacterium]|nr:MAG: hypothetical protein JSV78_06215 [Phycisphaerales bacterium]
MPRVAVRGLVRLADHVRRELSLPIGARSLAELRRTVAEAIKTVEGIVANRRATIADLPGPSRRAYVYLRGLNLDSVKAAAPDATPKRASASVNVPYIRSYVDSILDALANVPEASQLDETHHSIRSTSQSIEQTVIEAGLSAEQFTPQSRSARCWLAYFARRDNFDRYVRAVGRALPHLDRAAAASRPYKPPVLLHFRPMRGLFRIRGFRDGTRIKVPTPMICFDEDAFALLANVTLLGRDGKRQLLQLTETETYRTIQKDLNLLEGSTTPGHDSAGVCHDLSASFDRVNAGYFAGAMARPRLVWSRSVTGRKFGHYDPATDTVMISASLDAANVPAYVVDFVVYHELLHKTHETKWQGDRAQVHTPTFRHDERKFHQYAQAEAFLKKLANHYL